MTKNELDGDRIFVIDDFLSADECAELIQRSESLAYDAATVGDDLIVQVDHERQLALLIVVVPQEVPVIMRLELLSGTARGPAFRGRPHLSIKPKTGMALVFVHRVLHEGAVVESGLKYVLRTDVMYRVPPKAGADRPSE